MRFKWSKSEESLDAQFQNLVLLLTKNRYFVAIAFKMYTILITQA